MEVIKGLIELGRERACSYPVWSGGEPVAAALPAAASQPVHRQEDLHP